MTLRNPRFEFIRTLFHQKPDPGENGNINIGMFLVRQKSTGILCVMKTIDKDRADQEIFALRDLIDHPFVNRLIDLDIASAGGIVQVALYLEYCNLGSLQAVIRRCIYERNQRLPETFIWHVFKSMAKVLAYLHYGINEFASNRENERNWDFILHRDFKPGNIFLKTDPDPQKVYPQVVLGDFGASTHRSCLVSRPLPERYPSVGTRAFTPPESPRYDRKSDVWALAASIQDLMGVERQRGNEMILLPDLGNSGYSRELIACVALARKVDSYERCTAPQLVVELNTRFRAAIQWGVVTREANALPAWLFNDSTSRSRSAR